MVLLTTVHQSLVAVTADPEARHSSQRELRYVVQEERLIGSEVADIADDTGLVARYGPIVARSALRYRFLATPRVPVEIDERTGKIRTTGRLDRETICGDGGDHMELCLERLDVAVQPMNYFQIIKVPYTNVTINVLHFCRATLGIARPMSWRGVSLSVWMSDTFVYV